MLRFALLLVLDVPLSVSLLLFYDQSETSIFIFLTGDLIGYFEVGFLMNIMCSQVSLYLCG